MIETERLLLRPWKEKDRAPFAQLNTDPRVMEFLLKPLSREESDAFIDRIDAHFAEHGFGFFAAELKQDSSFAGLIGLAIPPCTVPFPFSPCVEIGWRLSASHWNQGLASEGARAVLHYAFETLQLPEIVSFTVPANKRSQRVIEKIGMTRDLAGDFDHPKVPESHPLRRHVLYRCNSTRKGPTL